MPKERGGGGLHLQPRPVQRGPQCAPDTSAALSCQPAQFTDISNCDAASEHLVTVKK